MELYTEKDIELSKDILPDRIKNIEQIKDDIFEPTKKERLEVNSIVLNYIKEYKRKIYGGTAINKLVIQKNPKDAFYESDEVPDIDIYSFDPIMDLKRLSNILYKLKYKSVEAKAAMHKETYTIFVNGFNACDITYVPANIYHRIPYEEINEIYYIGPSFAMIDMYRILTEPYFSSSLRWEKVFKRLYLLQKHYPFSKTSYSLDDPEILKNDKTYDMLLEESKSCIKNSKSLIVYGNHAYNYFLDKSNIEKTNKNKYKPFTKSYYECISTNYVQDVKDIINRLKLVHSDIVITEHYPLWQLLGYSTYIKYKSHTIIKIVHYQKKCTPILESDKIQYSSFDLCFLMNLINSFWARVNKDNTKYKQYNTLTTQLIEMRNYYLKTNKKTMFDDTPFQEFNVKCIGDAIDPMREEAILRKQRFLEHKQPFFKYNPDTNYEENPTNIYKFPNSSGNPIYSSKNYRIDDKTVAREERAVSIEDKENEEDKEYDEDKSDNSNVILDVKDLLKIKDIEVKTKRKKYIKTNKSNKK